MCQQQPWCCQRDTRCCTPGQCTGFRGQCRRPRVFHHQTDLAPQAIAIPDRQAQWLRAFPRYAFTLEGHADERGTREYNIALGASRAQNLRNYLISRGIDASRMRTISYGRERPAVCNDESCWSRDRRAVTVLNTSS